MAKTKAKVQRRKPKAPKRPKPKTPKRPKPKASGASSSSSYLSEVIRWKDGDTTKSDPFFILILNNITFEQPIGLLAQRLAHQGDDLGLPVELGI